MINLEINNQAKVRFNKNQLIKALGRAEKILKIKSTSRLSVALVGNREMKKLNRLYRGLNKTTDVLSFAPGSKVPVSRENQGYLGEVIISYPVARRQAKENQASLSDEIIRLVVHGLLHLTGYHHHGLKASRKNEQLAAKIQLFDKT